MAEKQQQPPPSLPKQPHCPIMRKTVPMDLSEAVNMDEDYRQFSVLDEVQGDGSASEFDGK